MLIIVRRPNTYPNRISGKTQSNLRLTPLERNFRQLIPVITRTDSTTARPARHRTVFVHINGGYRIAAATRFDNHRLTISIVTASVSGCANHPNANPRDSRKQENQDGQHSNHSVESSSVRCVNPSGCIATRSRDLIELPNYSSNRAPITLLPSYSGNQPPDSTESSVKTKKTLSIFYCVQSVIWPIGLLPGIEYPMAVAVLLSLVLVLLTTGFRLGFFMVAARHTLDAVHLTSHRFFCLMLSIYISHMVDIVIFALAFYFAWHVIDLGTISGSSAEGPFGHLYVSATIYTTIGFGDVLPTGHLRFIAVTEGLCGLLYLAWSASFIFSTMGRMLKDRNRLCEKIE